MSMRTKRKGSRDIKLWTILISIGSIFVFAIMVALFGRIFPSEILLFGIIPMSFSYFIWGLFILFVGIITSFFVARIVRAKNKTRRPKRLRK